MRYCTLFLLLIAFNFTYGQSTEFPQKPVARPLPPNETALFRTVQRPLGNYTGTVPVSFPLTSLHSGPMSIDLALNYNCTGGVKVAEIASAVGLGFSLSNGGGVITQQIRDKADDQGNGMINQVMAVKPSTWSCSNLTWADLKSKGYIDLEPDIYYYNVKGKSGRFIMKDDSTIAFCDNNGFALTYVWDNVFSIKKWILTDDEGNKYYFGQNKAGTVNYKMINLAFYNDGVYTNSEQSSVSWYLTEAYDMNEENKVTYSYISGGSVINTPALGFKQIGTMPLPCYQGNDYNIRNAPNPVMVQTSADEYLVSRIDASDGYLTFHYSNRTDNSQYKLDSIKQFGITSFVEKQFLFDYGYFTGSPRLKLKSFTQTGAVRTDSATHRFEYEESVNLPGPGYEAGMDFWGFYNGGSTYNLYPNYVCYDYGLGQKIRGSGANRHANPTYSVANILKKITFPTGGYRQFIYEGNTALINEDLLKFSPDPSLYVNRSFSNTTFNTTYFDPYPSYWKNFTINSAEGSATFTYNLAVNPTGCTNYRVAIWTATSPTDSVGGTEIYSWTGLTTKSQDLPNGNYRLEVYRTPPSGCTTMIGIPGAWSEYNLPSATVSVPLVGSYVKLDRKVGGVRVQEVRDYDPLTAKNSSTYYKYKLYSTDSTVTSGLLISKVNIIAYQTMQGGCTFAKLVPPASYPLSTQDNAYCVYPEVRTIESGNGWVDNLYSFIADNDPATNPETPVFKQTERRGLLRAQNFYDQTGKVVKKSSFTYSFQTPASQPGWRVRPYWAFNTLFLSVIKPTTGFPVIVQDCALYNTPASFALLTGRNDSIISPYGVGTRVNTTYTYTPYQRGFLLKTETTAINNNQTKVRTYKYASTPSAEFTFPWSVSESGSAIATLVANNYRKPIEIIDSLKPANGAGSFISAERYYFAPFSSKYHIEKIRSYTTPSVYSEYNISLYDSKGNPMESYKTGGITEVYLWGYGRTRLVGIVKGAQYSLVSTLFDPTTLDQFPPGLTTIRTQMNLIRTGLASTAAQVTTFSWQKNDNYSWEINAANKQTTYFTDFLGRLTSVQDHGFNYLKKIEYKMSGTN